MKYGVIRSDLLRKKVDKELSTKRSTKKIICRTSSAKSLILMKDPVQEKIEMLNKTMEELQNSGITLIVEGKRDVASLVKAGIENKMKTLNKRPDELAMSLSGNEEVAILSDFDKKGEEIAKRLEEALQSYGIKANLKYRERFKRLLGIHTFEEFSPMLEKLKGDVIGENLYRHSKIRSSGRRESRRDG